MAARSAMRMGGKVNMLVNINNSFEHVNKIEGFGVGRANASEKPRAANLPLKWARRWFRGCAASKRSSSYEPLPILLALTVRRRSARASTSGRSLFAPWSHPAVLCQRRRPSSSKASSRWCCRFPAAASLHSRSRRPTTTSPAVDCAPIEQSMLTVTCEFASPDAPRTSARRRSTESIFSAADVGQPSGNASSMIQMLPWRRNDAEASA